jgi:hypothetical protein
VIKTMRNIPYFSQWVSSEHIADYVANRQHAALDERWQEFGAPCIADYVTWAPNVCGMTCLKMFFAHQKQDYSWFHLTQLATQYGGYIESESGIKGLIYQPAIHMLKAEFQQDAEILVHVDARSIAKRFIQAPDAFYMASVHTSIRFYPQEKNPPSQGGHLVLIHHYDQKKRCFCFTQSIWVYTRTTSQFHHLC